MKPLEEYLRPTQAELYAMLRKMFPGNVSCKNKYILVKGQAPVMLVAHLDTVHKEPVKTICKSENGNILMSPQGIGGDDRCGVYALVTVHSRVTVKPWLLFTCDEEIGGVGASAFCKMHKKKKLPAELDSLKLIIEIDRKGQNDAVYYDCGNDEFEAYITSKGFKTDFGSFSDISSIAPELGVAAVNLSSGYYNAHTQHEYINRKHLNATVNRVCQIVEEAAAPGFPAYEYVESVRGFGRYGGWGAYDYYGWDGGTNWGKPTSEYKPSPEYQLMYEDLLDLYGDKELAQLVEENGEWVIEQIWQDEFGADFFDAPDEEKAEEEEVQVKCSGNLAMT